ncbi:MAG: ABC transporter ATP-binding protein [Candidatus Eremiobacteraeota bacterium]|nr:ABC transporter ATP-binding protein [Candidatus Eremiobacteraeota bacterium]
MDVIPARLRAASKRYDDFVALDRLDLELHAGETLALLGPNGAGKTTAIRLLLGLGRPTSGSATIFGHDPRSAASRIRVGAMLQVANVPATLTVREHVTLFSSYYPRPLPLARTLSLAMLERLASRRFGDLSGGERQRLFFALAICGDPDVLFLDEPTVGLDVETRRQLWGSVRELVVRGKSILLTTHYLEEADALADRVVMLAHGAVLASGTPRELKKLSGATADAGLESAYLSLTKEVA